MTLNTEQQVAVDCTANQILLSAAAGSGKSTTVVARICRLVRDGVDPRTVVAITFTTTSAKDLRGKLEKAGVSNLMYVGTIHGWCLRLLLKHGRLINLPTSLTVCGQAVAKEIVEELVVTLKYGGTKDTLEREIRDNPLISRPVTPSPAQQVAMAFHRRLLEAGMVTFDSMQGYALHLLKKTDVFEDHPEADEVVKWQPDHIFVDECQDLSLLDWSIYRNIRCQTRFMVGDPDQSVYNFRGAAMDEFLATARDKRWTQLTLVQNYRSDTRICDAANNLIEFNSKRIKKQIVPNTKEPGTVHAMHLADQGTELKGVVFWVQQAQSHGTLAILCRYNKQVAFFKNGLREAGVALPERQTKGSEWDSLCNRIALLINPRNNQLAVTELKRIRTPAIVKEIRIRAAAEIKPIAFLIADLYPAGWALNLPARQIEAAMRFLNDKFGLMSMKRLADLVAELPEESTLSDLLVAMNEEEAEKVISRVVVLTIHRAKGLEFDHVFLPGWNDQQFPGYRKENLEEERRLAFVSVTRARHSATITSTDMTVLWDGPPQPTTPSRFIEECGLND